MRYLIQTNMCVVSLEDPEITDLFIAYFPDRQQFAADFALEDIHGSRVLIFSGYLGENITETPTDEEARAVIMSVYLPPFQKP